jgi:hypothetical protein
LGSKANYSQGKPLLSFSFTPLVPWPVLTALAFVTLIAAGYALIHKGPGAIIRAAALLALLAALSDPSLVREEREPLRDVAVVVVDRSASQNLGERFAQTDFLQAQITDRIKALPNIDLRLVEVKDSAADQGTKLFEALNLTLSDMPSERVAGVIAITDGVVHDLPALSRPLSFKGPFHALITGQEQEKDRRIVLLDAPRFGLVGREQVLRAVVEEKGGSGMALVTIRRDGQVLSQGIRPTNQSFSVPVRIDHGGETVIEMETDALPNELTLANNRAVLTIEGIREKLKVLLVSGEPHAGERTWRNLLKSDANVDLVHFTILRPPEKQDGTPINELSLIAFPTRELFQVKIKEFDLIIFDRYANQSILPSSYFENITRYVKEGGALLVASGPELAGAGSLARTRLGSILPALPDNKVIEEAFKPQLMPVGRRHPVTRDLPGADQLNPPWGEWLRVVSAQIRSGHAVLSGAGAPLLVLSREEQGRVALLLSDHAWLWARGYRQGGPHHELLRSLAHWLMKEPALEEEALRAKAVAGELRITRQTLQDTVPAATLSLPSGKSVPLSFKSLKPGLFEAVFNSSEQGLHVARTEALVAFASVGPANPKELENVFSTPSLLEPVAQVQGGSVRRTPIEAPKVQLVSSSQKLSGEDWIGLKPSGSYVTKGLSVFSLGTGLAGLVLLLGFVLAAWIKEGRRG